jgi:hypothetical protein
MMMTQEKEQNPSLIEAVRLARQNEALRQDALLAGREIEFERLSLLADYLTPVFKDIPPSIDMFDVGVVAGARPRYFIDMVSFVEMDETRQIYSFYQDTRVGRQLLGQSKKIEGIAQLILNYVAHRLVAREQLLAFQPQAYEQTILPQETMPATVFQQETPVKKEAPQAEMRATAFDLPQDNTMPIEKVKEVQEINLEPSFVQENKPLLNFPEVRLAKQDLRAQVLQSVQKLSVKPTKEYLYTALYAIMGVALAVSAYTLLSRLIGMALNQ